MAVIRGNKAKIPTARKSPDKTFMGPLQNTDDLSLTPSPIAMVTDPCDYKVLVHRTGDEKITFLRLFKGYNKPIPFLRDLQAPCDKPHGPRQAQGIEAGLHKKPILDH